MKSKIKELWFKAEDKSVEYSKLDIFKTLSKLVYTMAMLVLCLIVFIIYCIGELITYAKEKIQRKDDVEKLDEYSAQEGYTVPEKIEPGEMSKVDRVRKWM